jgi:hypothetical protein
MEVSGQLHVSATFNSREWSPEPWACLDAVANRIKKIPATAGNRTPVVHPVAESLY